MGTDFGEKRFSYHGGRKIMDEDGNVLYNWAMFLRSFI